MRNDGDIERAFGAFAWEANGGLQLQAKPIPECEIWGGVCGPGKGGNESF